MKNQFRIPTCNMESFTAKFNKQAKKAKRLGGLMTFEILNTEVDEVKDGQYVEYTVIDVEGERPQIEGHKFIAKLEHTENGNIIRKLEAVDMDLTSYVNAGNYCEHCNSRRTRKDTFLLLEEATGTIKQIGRNCLANYLGTTTAEHIAQLHEFYEEFEDGITEYTSMSGSYESMFPVDRIFQLAVACIKRYGYKKVSETNSTASDVSEQIRPLNIKPSGSSKGYKTEILEITEEVKAEALAVKEWILEQTNVNEYMQNLQVIVKNGFVKYRQFGYIVSAPASYYRAFNVVKEREKAISSQFQGTVGDKVVVELSVQRTVVIDGMYGISYINIMQDANGNTYLWNTKQSLEGTVILKGTIKAHEDYKGVKQTVLTRCKVQ